MHLSMKRGIADLCLLCVTAIWGISFVLTKNVLEHLSPLTFIALRFLVATVAMLVVCIKKRSKVTAPALKKGGLQGMMLFAGILLQIFGIRYTTASNAAFITGLSVVFVPLISSILLKKPPRLNVITGVFLSFVGLFFLSGGIKGLSTGINIGDFLCLLGALGFSMHIIFIDKYSTGEDPTVLSAVQVIVVAAAGSIAFLFQPEKTVTPSFSLIAVLLITGVLGTAVAYTVQNHAQNVTTPTHTAMIVAAEPMFGVFFALIIPNAGGTTEVLKLNTVIGCLCILLAIIISELNSKSSHAYVKEE